MTKTKTKTPMRRMLATLALTVLAALPLPSIATQSDAADPHVDLAIALDVSGSMSGLIESAKQRLWDVVNELGRAQPQPELRVAILSYGNPAYGAESGYVRIDQPFTSDLDAVNATLFAFGTNGGDEYVARAVDTAVRSLQWTPGPDALRIIFVAGNEPATQDPRLSAVLAAHTAADRGIVVNTIYCGSEHDGLATGWQDFAALTNGLYASIDMQAAAVANVSTPMDAELAKLNEQLNDTYVAYGALGSARIANQRRQDANAMQMSIPAAASRAVTKASPLYRYADSDLVDAMAAGTAVEEIAEEDLPEALRDLSPAARKELVEEKAAKRQELQAQITQIADSRRAYIAGQREREAGTEQGLDDALQQGLRRAAEAKGFTFE